VTMSHRAALLCVAIVALSAAPAGAAITPNRNAGDLANAMKGPSIGVNSAAFDSITAAGNPVAIADAPLGGMPTDGSTFAILTTGDATLADKPNTSNADVQNGGQKVRGDTDRDVLILKINVTVPSGANCLTIDFRFFSDEYPEFVGGNFNDAFIAELDGSDWTTQGSKITAPRNFAFDDKGNVVSINATGPASVSAGDATGTTYDAATVLLHASTAAAPGAHDLYLSIFDQGDQRYDSAVFVDNIVASNVGGGCKAGATNQPTPPPASPPPTTTTPTTTTPATPPPTTTAPPASGPTGSPPPAFGPGGVITGLPSSKKCVSKRNFRIRIRKRKGRTYQFVSVFLNGKRIQTRRGARVTAPIDLRGLPKGRFRVKIVVVTTTGEVIQGTRRYRTCAKKRPGGRRPRL